MVFHQPLLEKYAPPSWVKINLPQFSLVKNVESLWVATTQTIVCKSTLQIFFPSSFSIISSKSSVNKTKPASRRITSQKILQAKFVALQNQSHFPLRLRGTPRDKLLKGEASVRGVGSKNLHGYTSHFRPWKYRHSLGRCFSLFVCQVLELFLKIPELFLRAKKNDKSPELFLKLLTNHQS